MRESGITSYSRTATLATIVILLAEKATSFQQSYIGIGTKQHIIGIDGRPGVTALHSAIDNTVSLDRTATRDIGQMQDWAVQCGVQPDNGFCLVDGIVDGNEDWYAATSTGAERGSCVLSVPNEMILSSQLIAREYGSYAEESVRYLQSRGMDEFIPQFYLFLRVLVEYESGTDSPYYPWLASMPRKWNTAVSMDDFCLSVLPPYIKTLCNTEREQFDAFRVALRTFEYIRPESKADVELVKFAYNVVSTRSWTVGDGSLGIVPIADMINHGNEDNVSLYYDDNGNCQVVLLEDAYPGAPLHISYGPPSNPSRFFAKYGFLNEAPATYCKFVVPNPSDELLNIGYDPSKMLFGTTDGGISNEVWDVVLYSRLERRRGPEIEADRSAFYRAHMEGDEATKSAIHGKYFDDTCRALRRQVDHIISELFDLKVKTNAYDSSNHPRLPLIIRHNDMVASTFQKVKTNLDQMLGPQ